MPPASPTVASWELGLRLRERRELMGVTALSTGKSVGTGQAYISGVETGKLKISESKLAELAAVLEFNGSETAELQELREAANQRGWWAPYSAMFNDNLLRFFGFEYGAESIRTYSAGLISGWLQTTDYARAVMSAGAPTIRLAEAERRIEARMKRQRRLDGDDPLHLTALINESALRHQVGGPSVLQAQLRHLEARVEQRPDNIDIRVIPFTAPCYNALDGSTFHILSFSSTRLPDLAWQETITSTDLIDQGMRVREYDLAYDQAMESALDQADSLSLIKQIGEELE